MLFILILTFNFEVTGGLICDDVSCVKHKGRGYKLEPFLTLRLLMSYIYIYIYIYMELLVKPEMLTSYIQGVPGGM